MSDSWPMEMVPDLVLDDDHFLNYHAWMPDRELNPQYAHLPDVQKFGCVIRHYKDDGTMCEGCVTFDGPVQRELVPQDHRWTVESWQPLSLYPSIVCGACGDHGWIREGKWVKA